MVRKAAHKTLAEQREGRLAELDYFQQLNAQRAEQMAAREAEHNAFLARVQARQEAREQAISAAVEQAERQPGEDYYAFTRRVEREAVEHELVEQAGTLPRLSSIRAQEREAEKAAQAEAERQRIAAISPRTRWFNTLPWAERQRVLAYERINGEPWPYAPVG